MGTNVFRRCRKCNDRFEVRREWQLFCGDGCRQLWNYREKGWCFYCGEPGDSRDHIHPVAARGEARRVFADQETVYACTECNSTLGGLIFDRIEARVGYLINRYRKKYKLDLPEVRWSEQEVGVLGRNLRARIKKLLAKREKAERRQCYLEAVYYELLKLVA